MLFCNSGAEANEAAFKIARRTGRPNIIAAENAFHGRTMGALALTGQQPKRTPFEPMTAGRDARALRRRRRAGRGRRRRHRRGVPGADPGRGRRGHPAGRATWPPPGRSPPRAGALLVLDEVQTGIGRTGVLVRLSSRPGSCPTWSRWPRASAAGCRSAPASASARPATLLEPGQHGTTFGGNPVCCAAALAVLRTIADEGLLEHVTQVGKELATGIEALGHPLVRRGRAGPGCCSASGSPSRSPPPVAAAARDAGFLVNNAVPDRRPAGPAAGAHRGAGRRVPRRAAAFLDAGQVAAGDRCRPIRHFLRDDDLTPGRAGARCSTWPTR